jgi:hypothetical protein
MFADLGLGELLEGGAAVHAVRHGGLLDTVKLHPQGQLAVLITLVRLSYHLLSVQKLFLSYGLFLILQRRKI